MAMHSSILAWRIPWTEEPGGCKESDIKRENLVDTDVKIGEGSISSVRLQGPALCMVMTFIRVG